MPHRRFAFLLSLALLFCAPPALAKDAPADPFPWLEDVGGERFGRTERGDEEQSSWAAMKHGNLESLEQKLGFS